MSFAKARQRIAESAAAHEQANHQAQNRCNAMGCPCRASVSTGGSGWMCRYHVAAAADKWPRITDALAQNDWLLAFIAEAQKMARELKPWREFALRFWDHDPAGGPAAFETDSAYLYRMELELLHRCGQYPRRPEPRDPAVLTVNFRAKNRMQWEAA